MKTWDCKQCGGQMNINMVQQGGMHVGCAEVWLDEQRKKVKLFKMNDCDWYAAATLDEAIKQLRSDFSHPNVNQTDAEFAEEFLENPRELTDEEMGRLQFREEEYEDEDDLDENGEAKEKGGEKKSFRQKLDEMIVAGEKFPCIFASTEY